MSEPPGHTDVAARLAAALERIGAAGRTLLRTAASAHGLSPTQAQLVLRLRQTADEPNQHEPLALARWLDVSAPTVSDAVAALERKGLVSRAVGGPDLRRVSVRLTARGSSVAGELADWDAPLRAAVTAAGSPPDAGLPALLELSLRTIAALQRAGVVTVARTCTACRFFQPRSDADTPYWCGLLDAPLEPATLRLDCPEYDSA